MALLKALFTVALALWVGGLAILMAVVTPAAFRSLPKEEVGRYLGVLFPMANRWFLFWSATAMVALFFLFLNRHFHLRSLVIEIPLGLMFVLTVYASLILYPQIHDMKRKIHLPEFQGTAHQQTMTFAFNQLHMRSVQIHAAVLVLGIISLILTPKFLE